MIDPTSRVAVVLASAGRPALLDAAVRNCTAQTDVHFRGVISVPDHSSLPLNHGVLEGWQILAKARGLAAQRNAGLDCLSGEVDVVFFFDDDAVLRSDYIANAVKFLCTHPDVLGLTGQVLADGKVSGEIGELEAEETLAQSWEDPLSHCWKPTRELYGANFAIRVSAVPELRFDERLPLYSWLEDHDFARRLMRAGPLVHVADCRMVHRAAASGGRTNHRRLGYSQVMNAVYLRRKGSFPYWLAAQQIARPTLKNIALSIAGKSATWRRQRLGGNLIATKDVLRGRITPERILDIHESKNASSRFRGGLAKK